MSGIQMFSEARPPAARQTRTSLPSSRVIAAMGAPGDVPSVPAHAFPHRTPTQLLALAHAALADAAREPGDAQRFAAAHMAALRAAAAVIAARAKPTASLRSRVTSAWDLLPVISPQLAEWAALFAAGARKRSAAEAGITRLVSADEADALLRSARVFVAAVEEELGFQSPLFSQGRRAA